MWLRHLNPGLTWSQCCRITGSRSLGELEAALLIIGGHCRRKHVELFGTEQICEHRGKNEQSCINQRSRIRFPQKLARVNGARLLSQSNFILPQQHLVTSVQGCHVSSRYDFHSSSKQTPEGTKSFRKLQIDPLENLQRYVSVPIIPKSYRGFSPSDEELMAGQNLFIATETRHIRRVASVRQKSDWPESSKPEILLIGRSNVGKSSLLNALFAEAPQASSLIRVSATPGRTRRLQFFNVKDKFTLVDAPGYGYNMPYHYARTVETYLRERENLCQTLVLIDSREGITPADEIGLQMMEEHQRPYVIVITKIDKIQKFPLIKTLGAVMSHRDRYTQYCLPQPFFISSHSGDGLILLKTFIGHITGALDIKSSQPSAT